MDLDTVVGLGEVDTVTFLESLDSNARDGEESRGRLRGERNDEREMYAYGQSRGRMEGLPHSSRCRCESAVKSSLDRSTREEEPSRHFRWNFAEGERRRFERTPFFAHVALPLSSECSVNTSSSLQSLSDGIVADASFARISRAQNPVDLSIGFRALRNHSFPQGFSVVSLALRGMKRYAHRTEDGFGQRQNARSSTS